MATQALLSFSEEISVPTISLDSTAAWERVSELADGRMDVDLPEPLSAPSPVRVEFAPDCFVNGDVEFCNRRDQTYRARIRFRSEIHASPACKLILGVLLGAFSNPVPKAAGVQK